jgi:hypothetical protein
MPSPARRPRVTLADPIANATTRRGARVTFTIVVGNVPLDNPAGFPPVVDDQAKTIAAIWRDL